MPKQQISRSLRDSIIRSMEQQQGRAETVLGAEYVGRLREKGLTGLADALERNIATAIHNNAAAVLTLISEAEVLPDPDPDPTPTLPPPEIRPFDPAHPVYRPIPQDCPLWSGNINLTNRRGIAFDTGADSPGVFLGRESDPMWTASIAGRSFTFRAPESISAGSGSDFPVVVLDTVAKIEYRMWQVRVDRSTRKITCSNGGVGSYAQKPGAMGRAEHHGSNTGSGLSYTVGMIRPHEIEQGHIPHAIRIASSFIGGSFVSPADRTDQSGSVPGAPPGEVPMGIRMFLDHSVSLATLDAQIDARVPSSNPLGRKALKTIVKAIQQYGFIFCDGSASDYNLYFEGEYTAPWTDVMGPKNSYGSYNDLARALSAILPWAQMRFADPKVTAE